MANVDLVIKMKVSKLLNPYLALTRFGIWLGLPINIDVVLRDVQRMVKIEVIYNGRKI